jgi:hypothetical protein
MVGNVPVLKVENYSAAVDRGGHVVTEGAGL